ncbi:MAG: hypothetical protein DSY53_00770 [Persephonella sp.]|nr:MAG: hypothetical protein DSY53_00770 [Persephonella sp.]
MILKRLRLINFLSHTDTEINFSDKGIIAFIGENGAGKTSIIEGITYALIGQSSKGKADKLVQWGKNFAKVELEFRKGNTDYKVEREINLRGQKANTLATVYKKEKGDYRLYYQKNVNKELPKITGLTRRTFFYTTLIRQGDIEGLINLSSSKRAEVFEELLDLKLYQLIVEKVADYRKLYERDVNNLIASIDVDEEELKSRIDKLERELFNQKKDLEKKENERNEIDERLKNLKNLLKTKELEREKILNTEKTISNKQVEIKNLKERLEEIEKRIKDIEGLKEKLKVLEPSLEKLEINRKLKEKFNKREHLIKDLKQLEEKLIELNKYKDFVEKYKDVYIEYLEKEKRREEINSKVVEISKLEGKSENINREIESLKNKRSNLYKQALEIVQELLKYKQIYKPLELNPTLINQYISNNEEDIKRLEDELKTISSKKEVLRREGANLKKQIEKIEKLEGKCPTCLRPLEEHSKEEILEELNREIEKKREEWRELDKKEKELNKKLSTEKIIKKLLEDFKNIYEKYRDIEEDIKNLQVELFKVKKALSEREKIYKELDELKDFIQKNKNIFIQYKNAEESLKKFDEKSLKERIENLKKEIEDINLEIKDINIKNLEEEIKKLEKDREEFIKIREKVKEEENLKSEIEKIKKNLQNLDSLVKELRNSISNKEELLKDIKNINSQIDELMEKLKEINEGITDKKVSIKGLEKELIILKDKLKEIEDKKKKIEKLKIYIAKSKKIEEVLGKNGIQKILRDNLLFELPKLVNDTFSKFGFPFEQIKFSENFDIYLLAPTKERRDRLVDVSSISGGQRVALGLALRLSLAKFLSSKSSFLILDEPTIHLDEQRKSELVNLLIKLKNDGFIRQLIIVSHDTEIEDTADSIYYINRGAVKEVG